MLTNIKIDRLKPSDKTKRYSDRDGLTIEVRPTGNKRFIFRFQWNNKPQTITLGRYPSLTLSNARQIASSYRSLVDNGIDPRKQFNAENFKPTFKNIAEKWFSKKSNSWREKTMKKHRGSFERDIYPLIGDIPIDLITKANLLQVMHPHDEKGYTEITHRLYYRLKCVFELANASGITDNFPFNGLKKAIAPKARITNHPSIQPSLAHEMMDKIRKCNAGIVTKLYIELQAILLLRPSELRLGKWNELNLEKKEWLIPGSRMKMGEDHWVPLPNKAIEYLNQLWLINSCSPYVFNSPTIQNQPISETSARKLIEKAGYKNIHSLHGFRALSCSVINSESTFRADAVEAQQARKPAGVRSVYMRADFKSERREMMEWYSLWLYNNSDH